MSKNNDPLKEMMEKRYAEIQQQETEQVVKETKKTGEVATIYTPYQIKNQYYLCKIEISLDIADNGVVDSSVEIVGVVPFAQKVVAKVHQNRQDSGLKHYYEAAKNKELLT